MGPTPRVVGAVGGGGGGCESCECELGRVDCWEGSVFVVLASGDPVGVDILYMGFSFPNGVPGIGRLYPVLAVGVCVIVASCVSMLEL